MGWGRLCLETGPREAILIELNPRLTTSFVAIQKLLPEGAIARAWLEMFEKGDCAPARELAETLSKKTPTPFVV